MTLFTWSYLVEWTFFYFDLTNYYVFNLLCLHYNDIFGFFSKIYKSLALLKVRYTGKTDSVIKFYITNPIIQQQVAQQPTNVLIPMDTFQFCSLIGDQACVFMISNFKILFNQTTQDNLGNWNLNGESQNIGPNPINNVMVVWHLYDALGNIVGVTQGSPIPSNLLIGQTTLFNLQMKPTDLTGIPKFYRISLTLKYKRNSNFY